ncbi:hypothetical protein [Flavobacterium hungaricum]|uniref:Lipoprotein n=1 Tax=Flavobacterium hungaricum TaxID=2082725 RepID=A0ABR9TRB9_9FLAO|nr:hypothetical protein [Flavobacterium hungaricum]MBE8727918.1 hypothetical protein [Flavobacterium hungaricum]
MKKLYFPLFLVLSLIILSCEKRIDELKFEKNVMYEIFPAMMDSVWVNAVLTYVPPPPPGVDPSEYKLNKRNESNKRFNKELAELKKKKFPVDLVLFDKAVIIDNSKELQQHFKDAAILKNNTVDTIEYNFDRKKLDAYKAFHLKYVSKIPKGDQRQLYNNCCYTIRGMLVLSRIQFDSEKKYGVLSVGIECGPMCGYGYRIYIKKVKDKWVIDQIQDAWIA